MQTPCHAGAWYCCMCLCTTSAVLCCLPLSSACCRADLVSPGVNLQTRMCDFVTPVVLVSSLLSTYWWAGLLSPGVDLQTRWCMMLLHVSLRHPCCVVASSLSSACCWPCVPWCEFANTLVHGVAVCVTVSPLLGCGAYPVICVLQDWPCVPCCEFANTLVHDIAVCVIVSPLLCCGVSPVICVLQD